MRIFDFNAALFSLFQTHIDKGNDMLEEASVLGQTGTMEGEAAGLKDVAKVLKSRMRLFTGRLEDTREKIEGTSKCYAMLDKVRCPSKFWLSSLFLPFIVA